MVDDEVLEPDPDDRAEPTAEAADFGAGDKTKRFRLAEMSPVRLATAVGLSALVVLTAVCGWLGYSTYQEKKAAHLRQELIQVARQGAVNLTTIDFEHADDDVKRILESSTGQFFDEFSSRSAPFIEVVKKVQSKSAGTVTAAGIESVSGQEGQVLVAVTVKTTKRGVPDEQPRYWRMRMTVAKQGADAKVAKVEFVP